MNNWGRFYLFAIYFGKIEPSPILILFRLQIQICGIKGVFVNEFLARFHLVAHEGGKDFIGNDGVIYPHLEQGPFLRIHRRFQELAGVHLSKTFISLDGKGFFTGIRDEIDELGQREKFLYTDAFFQANLIGRLADHGQAA